MEILRRDDAQFEPRVLNVALLHVAAHHRERSDLWSSPVLVSQHYPTCR